MLRSYDPAAAADRAGLDVPDPYFGAGETFEHVLDLVEAACAGLLHEVQAAVAEGRTDR